jgi:hypothetical protein
MMGCMMKNFLISVMTIVSLNTSALDFTFSRDDRPVDGDNVVLSISGEGKNQSISLTSRYFSRREGKLVVDTLFAQNSMICGEYFYTSGNVEIFAGVSCSRDERPVDGVMNNINVQLNERGTFDVVLFTSFYSRVDGKEIKEIKNLANNLKLN